MPAIRLADAAVDCITTASTVGANPTQLSVWQWIKVNTYTSGGAQWGGPFALVGGASIFQQRCSDTIGNVLLRLQATTSGTRTTTSTPLAGSAWFLFVATQDTGANPNSNLMIGGLDLSVAMAVATFGTNTQLVSLGIENGGTFLFGNRYSGSVIGATSCGADYGPSGFCTGILTLADAESIRRSPRAYGTSPSFFRFGLNGLSTQKDYGSGRDATVTNGTVVAGPPLYERRDDMRQFASRQRRNN